jgi:gas vesicle protein
MPNNAGKTIATFLIGAAVGAAAGYLIGTDKEQREEQFNKITSTARKNFEQIKDKVKDKLGRKSADLEQEIYNA